MSTLVCFHAHPDDECIATGGVMAQASAAGHRVVLIMATDGELGFTVEGAAETADELGAHRRAEAQASASILGVHRVEFLGYRDSGMAGEDTNDHPACFARADVEEAAERVASILAEERADVFTIYDDHGGYGHPDHIAVHTVGTRAAELTPVPSVLWATMNRDRIREQMAGAAELMAELDDADGDTPEMDETMGSPESLITHGVDVTATIDAKRRAMVAHASQISEDSWFLKMPADVFEMAFGHEWFVDPANPRSAGDPMIDHVL
ncbi:MAG: PIG-L family deacetylase [Microthrixaceae bacterium]|nr:PIG-L family deacetylase [Microthrixaceae bacterium]